MKQNYCLVNDRLFVHQTILLKKEVPSKTIKNGIDKFIKGSSIFWAVLDPNETKQNGIWIDYESIPLNTINRYKLPKTKDEFVLKYSNQAVKSNNKSFIELGLNHAYKNQWPIYATQYKKHINDENKIIRYAKNHALFQEILQIQESRSEVKIYEFFKVYQDFDDLIFKTENLKSFHRKLKAAKSKGIFEVLFHKTIGKSLEKKLTQVHKHLIFKKYKTGKYTYRIFIKMLILSLFQKALPKNVSNVETY